MAKPRDEQIPAAPFVAWIATELAKDGGDEGAQKRLAHRLGLDPRALWRYKASRRAGSRNGRKGDFPTTTFPRGGVEEALHFAGVFLWEVYPDLDEDVEVREGYCTHCDETVLATAEDRCLWCDAPLANPESRAQRIVRLGRVCPTCRGPKSRGAIRCHACAIAARPRTRAGTWSPAREPDALICPDCGGARSPGARRCWKCYAKRGTHTGRRNRGSRAEKMDERVLLAARDLYQQGHSIRAVAKRLYGETTYASERAFANSLFDQFKRRGWKMRDQRAMTAEANRRRAEENGLPICGYEKADGTVCQRRTSKGRCWHHRPENLGPRLAILHQR